MATVAMCAPVLCFTVRGTSEGGGRETGARVTAGGAGAGSSVERRVSERALLARWGSWAGLE